MDEEVRSETPMNPRIWVAGGGYMGVKGNNNVKTMEAYVDLWWSRDGVEWTPVSYTEGKERSLYSTSETYYIASQKRYIGKWGLKLVPFHHCPKRYSIIKSNDESGQRLMARQRNICQITSDTHCPVRYHTGESQAGRRNHNRSG